MKGCSGHLCLRISTIEQSALLHVHEVETGTWMLRHKRNEKQKEEEKELQEKLEVLHNKHGGNQGAKESEIEKEKLLGQPVEAEFQGVLTSEWLWGGEGQKETGEESKAYTRNVDGMMK